MIKRLEDIPVNNETRLVITRTSENTITISTLGYEHQDLFDAEKLVLGLGYKYDFSRDDDGFDRQSGRTFRRFKLRERK